MFEGSLRYSPIVIESPAIKPRETSQYIQKNKDFSPLCLHFSSLLKPRKTYKSMMMAGINSINGLKVRINYS
ncbi:MAG: hypothetical protein J7L96_10610, partial [Bacteroidales bacterium]|nr:hypothetical protein [Bacteroidales bacterium]